MLEKKIEIVNNLGLHARAAAKLVATASRFGSKIEISREGKSVNGKSIMGVMMLGASKGTSIGVMTEGDDENEAMVAIEELVNNRFGEEA